MAVETADSSETVRQECNNSASSRDSLVVSPDSSCTEDMSLMSEPGPSESGVIRRVIKEEPTDLRVPPRGLAYRADLKQPVLPQLLAGSPVVSSSTSPVPPRNYPSSVIMGPPPPPPPPPPAQQPLPKPAKASRPRKSGPNQRRSAVFERQEEPSSSIPEIGESTRKFLHIYLIRLF